MKALPGVAAGRLAGFDALNRGALARVWAALDGEGEEARLVGGAVRDLALGRTAQDFDFATTATPDVIVKRAHRAGLKVALTGVDHGTVTVIADSHAFETTTLRRDVETDGRRAKVAFGRDFDEDAERRDFTINALSLDATGRIHDPTGGLRDLSAGRVRFIGEARARVREDYLRILRFFRFSALFAEGPLDAEGLHACIVERDGLAGLSRERVRAELVKLLAAPRAADIVAAAAESGLLQNLLASACDPARLKKLVAVESATSAPPDAILRLAALAVRVVEDAERIAERLRLSNAERDRLLALGRALPMLHGLDEPPDGAGLKAWLFTQGRQAALDSLTLAFVDARTDPDARDFVAAVRELREAPAPVLPFGGADVRARGVEAGRQVGRALKNFQALWIRAGFPKDPSELSRLLDEAIRE